MRFKRILLSFCAVLIAVLFASSILYAQQSYDSLTVIHMADLHISNFQGFGSDLRQNRRKQYEDNYSAFEKFLKTIPKQMHADEIITSGDNIDFFNAEAADGQLKGRQIESFLELCKESPVPIYLTLGNHEISTFYTKSSKVKKNMKGGHYFAEEAKADWIRNAKCFENGTYYSQKVIVGGTQYLFLFLEANYRIPGKPTDAFWNPEMIEWINHLLDTNPDSKAVMFFHVPIPVADNNNDGKVLAKPIDGWPNSDSYKSGIMKTLNEHSNVKALFVGHDHENVIDELIFPDGKRIHEIETGSFGESENNWRILTFKKDLIKISKPGIRDTEFSIKVD